MNEFGLSDATSGPYAMKGITEQFFSPLPAQSRA